jgi:hypothetical protein
MPHHVPAGPLGLRPRSGAAAPRLAALADAVDAVRAIDVETVPPRLLADEVIALLAVVNQLHAMALDRLARVDAHGVAAEASGGTTTSWLRHHTGLPSGQAADLVRTARTLRSSLPATRDALSDGAITVHHARTIARTARTIGEAVEPAEEAAAVTEVEAVMLEVGRAVDAGSLSGFATRVRQAIDPDGALADAERAHQRRWLSTATTIDGMVSIDGLLDGESGAVLLTALAAATAPRGPEDHRSAGQRRADALVEICGHALDTGKSPVSGGVRPHLLVTTPLAAVVGRKRTSPPGPRSTESAELPWTGPLTDQAVRRMSCDAQITRVVIDPPSQPLDVGRSTRTVPVHLRHALIVRDRGCVAEGCDRPPAWTEAHHIVHWAEGGSTSLGNLVLLCRHHHRKVHDAGWEFAEIGGRWRLVPPPDTRLRYPVSPRGSADTGSDHRSDEVGDAGSHSSEQQLSSAGEEPGADRDPRHENPHPEQGEERDHQRRRE